MVQGDHERGDGETKGDHTEPQRDQADQPGVVAPGAAW
jgi:hypothetical protein